MRSSTWGSGESAAWRKRQVRTGRGSAARGSTVNSHVARRCRCDRGYSSRRSCCGDASIDTQDLARGEAGSIGQQEGDRCRHFFGAAIRPSGMLASNAAERVASARASAVIGVSMGPGATALTRTLCGATRAPGPASSRSGRPWRPHRLRPAGARPARSGSTRTRSIPSLRNHRGSALARRFEGGAEVHVEHGLPVLAGGRKTPPDDRTRRRGERRRRDHRVSSRLHA